MGLNIDVDVGRTILVDCVVYNFGCEIVTLIRLGVGCTNVWFVLVN